MAAAGGWSPAPAALDNRSLRSGAVGGGLRADARRAGRRADGLTCGLPSPDRRPRARALAGNRLPWAPAPPASPPRFPPRRRRRFCRLRPEPSGEWIPRGGGGPPGTVGCHGHPSPPVTILMRRRPRGPPGGVCGPGRSVLGRLGGDCREDGARVRPRVSRTWDPPGRLSRPPLLDHTFPRVASPIPAAERCASPWRGVPTSPPLRRGARRAGCAASASPLCWLGARPRAALLSLSRVGSGGAGGRHGVEGIGFALSGIRGHQEQAFGGSGRVATGAWTEFRTRVVPAGVGGAPA